MITKTKKSISPTMKVLKNNGFVRITYRLGNDNTGKQMWFEGNKGDFTVATTRGAKTFFLEIKNSETLEKIYNCLIGNGNEVVRELSYLEINY